MDSSSGQHHHQVQEMGGSQTLESMLGCTGKSGVGQQQVEKKGRPADMQAIKCPRCDSSNTKFCYYNNYSLSQPRYFCKSCRRYWTKGGTLRNVPVGGGCRKNKRSSSSSTTTTSSTSTTSSKNPPSLPPALTNANNPYDIHSNNDLSLAIARLQRQTAAAASSFDDHDHFSIWGNNNNQHQHHHLHLGAGGGGFLENPQSLYYGMNSSGLEMGMGMGGAQEIMGGGIPFEDFSPVKQEGVGRVLWGFPWHHNTTAAGNDHHHHHALINAANAPADLDSTTRSLINWNNGNWHGLLNTPLM